MFGFKLSENVIKDITNLRDKTGIVTMAMVVLIVQQLAIISVSFIFSLRL